MYSTPEVHLRPKSRARKSAHYLGWDWQSARRACARQFPCLHDVPNNKLLIYSTNYLLFLSGGGRGGGLKTWTLMTEYLPISAHSVIRTTHITLTFLWFSQCILKKTFSSFFQICPSFYSLCFSNDYKHI